MPATLNDVPAHAVEIVFRLLDSRDDLLNFALVNRRLLQIAQITCAFSGRFHAVKTKEDLITAVLHQADDVKISGETLLAEFVDALRIAQPPYVPRSLRLHSAALLPECMTSL